jgi:hypothetical protein
LVLYATLCGVCPDTVFLNSPVCLLERFSNERLRFSQPFDAVDGKFYISHAPVTDSGDISGKG